MTNCVPGVRVTARFAERFRPLRHMEVANKSVKLKFEPIASCLSEMTSPPGTRWRDSVNLEFELSQLAYSSSNERKLYFMALCTKSHCMFYDGESVSSFMLIDKVLD